MLKFNWMKNSHIAKILSITTLNFIVIMTSFSQLYGGYSIDILTYGLLTGLFTIFTIFFILNIKKIFSSINGTRKFVRQNIWIIFGILLYIIVLCFLNANSGMQKFAFMVISFEFLLLTLISYLEISYKSKKGVEKQICGKQM